MSVQRHDFDTQTGEVEPAADGHWVKFKERLAFDEVNVLEACANLSDAQVRWFQNSGPFRHICKAEMKRRGLT